MAKKKKRSTKAPTKKAKLSWHDEGHQLCKGLVKNSKSGLLVLSQSGDVIFKAGIAEKLDQVSVGALASGIKEACHQMDRMVGIKSHRIVMDDPKKAYWIEGLGSFLVLGFRLAPSKSLQAFYKHLKKKSQTPNSQSSEALAGLTDAGLEAALRGQGA